MLAQGSAVVDLTVTPFDVDMSAPPEAYVPWNLQLWKYNFVALSMDTPPWPDACVFLNVMFDTCICVGVVPVIESGYTLPSSSSVTATGLAPVLLIIVLSGPSPTKCAYGGMVSDAVVL